MLKELYETKDVLDDIIKGMRIIQEGLRERFNIHELREQLFALPEQIKKTQIVALQKKAELAEFEQQEIMQRTAEILFEINKEPSPNGKLKFSNEPTRKAELAIRLGKDEKYQGLLQHRSAIEFKLWEFEAETDKLRRQFQALLAHTDLICAELKLYTK